MLVNFQAAYVGRQGAALSVLQTLVGSAMWPFSDDKKSPAAATNEAAAVDKCPVDQEARKKWLPTQSSESHLLQGSGPRPPPASADLSQDRVISSIPRFSDTEPSSNDTGKWVYPSEKQFYTALHRKNRNPSAGDMQTVVPIHNAVNERAWSQILVWEREAGKDGLEVEGVKLVSFKGRPKDLSPRAWIKTLVGYRPPFDRHDWLIDRRGTRIRYVIDFYTGRSQAATNGPDLSFYLDVRPALDNVEGFRMRISHYFSNLLPTRDNTS